MWITGSWKGLPRIIARVFLSCAIKRFEANQVKAWPYLLKLAPPLSKRHQEPRCNENQKRLIQLVKYGK